MSDAKVIPFPRGQARVRPEAMVRWLLSHVDQITDLAFVVRMENTNPIVSKSDGCNPYFLTMASSLLHEQAMDSMTPKTPAPKK